MGTMSRQPDTLRQVVAWLAAAPAGTSVSAAELHRLLTDAAPEPIRPEAAVPVPVDSWRARLWSVPADTRLTLPEAAEALGKSRSWLYKRTGPKSTERLPCRRLEGELVFLAGELRRWIEDHEQVVERGRAERMRVS